MPAHNERAIEHLIAAWNGVNAAWNALAAQSDAAGNSYSELKCMARMRDRLEDIRVELDDLIDGRTAEKPTPKGA